MKIEVNSEITNLFGKYHPAYRPDVDGLRAIAVLFVIAYHVFPEWAIGGFVGVDIFFVISGFLISSIIFKGLSDNQFSYIYFYTRRIKRIFPALSLVLVTCLVIGSLLLFVDEYKQLGKDTVAGVAFVSNFMLLREGGYFSTAAELKPLLHLWSLGIEEQFYFIWPLLLVWVWRWPRQVGWIIAILAVTSLGANISIVDNHKDAAFYLPFTRFWELMAGALLAYRGVATKSSPSIDYESFFNPNSLGVSVQWLTNLLSWVGMLLIFLAFAKIHESLAYPGWWALVPVLGAMMVIAANQNAWINRVVLSSRVLVLVGLISYPLYLWHWPVLYFARVVEGGTPSFMTKGVVVLLSFVLSWITFRLIERPIRRLNGPNLRISAALCGLIVIPMVVGLAAYKTWVPLRLPDAWQAVAAARMDKYSPRSWGRDKLLKPFFLGEKEKADILFLGDSHMETYYPRVKKVLEEMTPRETGVVFATAGGCPPMPGVDRLYTPNPPGCASFFRQSIEFAKKAGVKKIVLAAAWDKYLLGKFDDPTATPLLYRDDDSKKRRINPGTDIFKTLFQEMKSEFSALINAGVKVYLILPAPSADVFDPGWMLENFDRLNHGKASTPTESYTNTADLRNFLQPVTEAFHEMSRQSGIILIDPLPYICTERMCSNLRNGQPMYMDNNHLARHFVTIHGGYVDIVFDMKQ
ncbi:acyltransferase [Gammaproteobacteria bacterium]|nr:acyltransferase [Gammaproteobacteria bacterium]